MSKDLYERAGVLMDDIEEASESGGWYADKEADLMDLIHEMALKTARITKRYARFVAAKAGK